MTPSPQSLSAAIDTRKWITRHSKKNGAPPTDEQIAAHIARHWPSLNWRDRLYAESNCRPTGNRTPFIFHI